MTQGYTFIDMVAHGVVQRSLDASYVVLNNTYHIPKDTEEFTLLWEQVDRWAKEHPEAVTIELPPPAPTEAEQQAGWARAIRSERDIRIAATDYLVMPDYPFRKEGVRGTWGVYRQELRDITEVEGFPWQGVDSAPWPVAPAPITLKQQDAPSWLM